MNKEELESQLSAMFDDELPAPECELLARRLARDEQLRERWGRYAAIGACVRGEPGVRLQTTLAGKVSAALKQENAQNGVPAAAGHKRGWFTPWVTSLAGLASAAAVAAVAILWMRSEAPALVAHNAPQQNPPAARPALRTAPATAPQLASVTPAAHLRASHEPDSYVTPAAVAQAPGLVPPTELANYIVAHSAYSGPLMRRNALSALVAVDSAAPPVNAQPIPAVVTGK
jgi:negative regulator of sigma E activity